MKRLLRSILDWLDRKFPDQVIVTQKDYDALLARVKYLEGEISKFNVSLGFLGVQNGGVTGQRQPFQR